MNFIDILIKMINSFSKNKTAPSEFSKDQLAYYWNNKWKHKIITYKAQKGIERDPRTYIFNKSYILEKVIRKMKLPKEDNKKAYAILLWVMRNIKYTGDKELHQQKEYWQTPEETIALKKGDCEDGALLIKSLALVAGISDYKMKICCGNVKGGAHAYVIYLRENIDDFRKGTWCVLDWVYWPSLLPVEKRKEHKDEIKYLDIWFTFNKEFTFAQHKAEYSKGKLIKKS